MLNFTNSFKHIFILCVYLLSTESYAFDVSQSSNPREYINEADKVQNSDIDRAYDLLNQAVNAAKKIEDADTELDAYIHQARLAKRQKEFFLAQQYLNRGERILSAVSNNTFKIEHLYLTAEILRLIKRYERALEYSKKAVALAKTVNDHLLLFKSITIQGNVYRSAKRYNDALASYLIGQDYLNQISNKDKVDLFSNIAATYTKLKQYQPAGRFHQKAILILEKTNSINKLPRALLDLAQSQKYSNDYGAALTSAKRALAISKEIKNEFYLLRALLKLSIFYRRLGSYELALDNGLEALSIYERNEDLNGIASAANSIGLLYVHLEQFNNAENYFKQVLSIPKENILLKYHGAALRELSLILMYKGEHQKALNLSLEAFNIYEKIQDDSGMTSVKKISGQIYQNMGNIANAKQTYLTGLLMSRDKKNKWGEAVNLSHLADLLSLTESKKAKEYALLSLTISEDIEAKLITEKNYTSLITIEKNNKNYQQALYYSELKAQLLDEVKTKAINQRIAELHVVLDIEKKERELINYKRQQTILSLELDRKQNELDLIAKDDAINALKSKNTYFVISALFVFFILIFILFIKLRNKP